MRELDSLILRALDRRFRAAGISCGRRIADPPCCGSPGLATRAGQAECQAADEFPDLIVLAQSRPGEFDLAALHALRRRAPLARVIAILGSWCAGETPSGTPLMGVVRLYWHEASAYLERELERQQAGKCPDWGLPITATEFDRVSPADSKPVAQAPRVIAIHSANRELANWLASSHVRAGGIQRPGSSPARRQHWKTRPQSFGMPGNWTTGNWRNCAWANVPRIVLVGFPHWEDRQRAVEAGAEVVLAKPLQLHDLRWHLDRLCESAAEVVPR